MAIVSSGQITITDLSDGKDGVGIKTTDITYAISTSGTTAPTAGWTSSVPSLVKGQYLWTQTTWAYTDNSSETGYSVSYISKDGNNGTDGIAGKDGVGISNTIIEYVGAVSGTSKPTSGWSATIPTVPAGQYLWTRTTWQYTDGTSEQGFTNALMGNTGATGPKGDQGSQGIQGLQGPAGTQGIAGPKGADGKTQYTHIAYANSADGVTNFSTSDSSRSYIGMYVNFNIDDSTNPSDYSWTLVKGADGTQGTPGKPGTDGKTPYFHTAWSYSADGADGFTTVYPNLNLLEGSKKYTKDHPYTFSSNASDGYEHVSDVFVKNLKAGTYTMSGKADAPWTNHVWGDRKGKVGLWLVSTTPGLNVNISLGDTVPKTIEVPEDGDYCVRNNTYSNGTDVVTHKFWDFKLEEGSIATPYMPSSSEVTTNDWPSYIGQYTDFTQADSTNPSDYTWSLMRGNDGKDGADGNDGIAGKDGKGIKSTAITYQASTNGTTAPTGTWSAGVPTVAKGSYLWTRTIWTYTDNTTETGYAVAYMGTNGNNGTDGIAGKDGVGIQNTTITYAGSTNGTTAPTSGWTSAVPTVAAGSYLWTKTVWTYTDNTSETGYSVAMMGVKGERGKQIFKSSYESIPNGTGHYWSDLSPAPSIDNPPKIGDTVITPSGNILQIDTVIVGGEGYGGGTFGVGDVLGNIKGPSGTDGTSGIIVSSVAPTSPQNGQLWQDTSITPQLVKKWTGTSWVIWELYAQNLKADSLSALSANLGDVSAGTVKLMADVNVNGTLKKYGLYQSKLGLLSSGPSLATQKTFSDSQMGVANLNRGELRFMVTDYTENLEGVQDAGMSDQNHAFIKFDSYDNGKDVMTIGSSGDIVFKGNTSQDTPWATLSSGVKYKFMFSRVYISVNVVGNGGSFMQFGTLPQNLRPISDLFLIIANQGAGTADDRHMMVRASDGAVVLWTPKSGITYSGEVSYTL